MKSKSLIKSYSPALVIMVLLAIIACRLDIQENRYVSELTHQSEIEIVSKIADVDSNQSSFYYSAFFQKNIHQLIVSPLYVDVLAYHDRINLQTFKRQKQIELSTDTKKRLLCYYSPIHFDTEYHEIIS